MDQKQDHAGQDSDGEGSQGIVEEKTREAQAGETGTTRFGMEGDDSDGAGSPGMVRPQNVQARDEARSEDLDG